MDQKIKFYDSVTIHTSTQLTVGKDFDFLHVMMFLGDSISFFTFWGCYEMVSWFEGPCITMNGFIFFLPRASEAFTF